MRMGCMGGARKVDAAGWGSMKGYAEPQHSPEVEYILYDADAAAAELHLEPHVDNGSKVSMITMLADPATFTGGTNFFGDSKQVARALTLKKGDAVFFRGECVNHWISDVTKGQRSILQIEMHMHDNKGAAIALNDADRRRGKADGLFHGGEYEAAAAEYQGVLHSIVRHEELCYTSGVKAAAAGVFGASRHGGGKFKPIGAALKAKRIRAMRCDAPTPSILARVHLVLFTLDS